MASGVAVLTWVGGGFEAPPSVSSGDEFVEGSTETSKTKIGRCFTVVGETKGPAKVTLAKLLREYWSACGFEITTRLEEGWRVERPDFYVLQIPLMGVIHNSARMNSIRDWLGPSTAATEIEQVRRHTADLQRELRMGQNDAVLDDRRMIGLPPPLMIEHRCNIRHSPFRASSVADSSAPVGRYRQPGTVSAKLFSASRIDAGLATGIPGAIFITSTVNQDSTS